VPAGMKEVWEYEQNRLRVINGGTNNLMDTLLHNKFIAYNLGHLLYLALIYTVFGGKATIFHILTSIIVL
jgi:hypothetical protein